jgi:hypothetical protein
LGSLYATHGFSFDLNVNDSFELGVERVNEYLYYDQILRKLHPEDPSSQARLTISEGCVNVRRALQNFSRKVSRDRTAPVSSQVDEKYGCFAGCIRYFVMWHANHAFNEIRVDNNRVSDYDMIRESRLPVGLRKSGGGMPVNTHGRKLVGTK